jgi:3',5'-cyclic AMP phosphodiesterase CpdA
VAVSLLLLLGCGGEPATTSPTEPVVDSAPVEPIACQGDDGAEATVLVAPYVQLVTPDSAWIVWETTAGEGSRVDFGEGETRDRAACGGVVPMFPGATAPTLTQVHEVHLDNLAPDTRYTYTARTGATTTAAATFRTAPAPGSGAPTHLVALGDSQRDDAQPDKLREVVQDGVIPWATAEWDPELAAAIDLVVLAGDLVDNGWEPDRWVDEFFTPAAPLLAEVPLYPVPGNHEGNSPLYFRYFHLPEGGDEHWYTLDHSNLRLVGLDSNPPYDQAPQLDWLDGVLTDTCDDPSIDFVFAELHHPHRSELWPAGESDWSGEVVARLERFSTDCGKPSVHLFGHTHGYSRGQSRDHQHLWVNVSSAGGALDRWGSTPQTNYPEFVTSQDTWGFVAVEITAGDDPSLRLRRVDRGNEDAPGANATTDDLTLRRDNLPPATPEPLEPGCDAVPELRASAFSDPDRGDRHQASHWQVAPTCGALDTPTVERWRQDQDRFDGADLQAGDLLTDEELPELLPGESVCWRVRYRDQGLAWSAWSTPATATCR